VLFLGDCSSKPTGQRNKADPAEKTAEPGIIPIIPKTRFLTISLTRVMIFMHIFIRQDK